ncbi:hypothetical protein Mapa_001457 [Marchantia paleacea]|nr:hypothetical protein Mapa_001457 [Marchantia paleacea]
MPSDFRKQDAKYETDTLVHTSNGPLAEVPALILFREIDPPHTRLSTDCLIAILANDRAPIPPVTQVKMRIR